MTDDATQGDSNRLLRFHLGEVAAGLRGLERRLQDAFSGGGSNVDWQRRDALASAVSVLEHVTEHHLSESQRLMDERLAAEPYSVELCDPLPRPALLVPSPPRNAAEVGETARALLPIIQRYTSSIDELLASLAAGQATDSTVVGVLAQLLEHTRTALIPVTNHIHATAVVCYQQQHPEDAHQEALDQALTIPERELAHHRADRLQQCPRCQAPLDRDDRTHDGSFCEACSTRWIRPDPISP